MKGFVESEPLKGKVFQSKDVLVKVVKEKQWFEKFLDENPCPKTVRELLDTLEDFPVENDDYL